MREATEGRVPSDTVVPRVQARTPEAGRWGGAVSGTQRPVCSRGFPARGRRPRGDTEPCCSQGHQTTCCFRRAPASRRPTGHVGSTGHPRGACAQAAGRRGKGRSCHSAPSTHGGPQVDVRRATWVVGKVSRHTGVIAWQDLGRKVPEGREPPGVCVGSQGRGLPWDCPIESGAAGWPSPQPGSWPSARVASPQESPELQDTQREPDATAGHLVA